MDRKQIMLIYVMCVYFCQCIVRGYDNRDFEQCINELKKGKDIAVCYTNNGDDWTLSLTHGGDKVFIKCDSKSDSESGSNERTLSPCTDSQGGDTSSEANFDFDKEGSSDTTITNRPTITTTRPKMHAHSAGDNLTAVYVLVPLAIVVAVVIVIIFVLLRRRSRSTLHNEDNVPVMDEGPVIPMHCLRESANVAEYAEIPADAILSSNVSANSYSTVDVVAVGDHEYGRLTKQTTPTIDTYSHMSTVSKPEHTDNTYSHIDNGCDDVKLNLAEDPDDEYNKVQRIPTNRTQNMMERKQNKGGECDPDYNHLQQSNWKPNIENQDEYSHIGQPIEQDGHTLHTKSAQMPAYEIADIDETKHELTESGGEGYKVAASDVDFVLKPENDNDGKLTAQSLNGQYFVLEKHEREAEVVSHDETPRETPRDHQYVILEKQEKGEM